LFWTTCANQGTTQIDSDPHAVDKILATLYSSISKGRNPQIFVTAFTNHLS